MHSRHAQEPAVLHRFFKGKGDVWRLLQDLSDAIDGRTWPSESEADVRAHAHCRVLFWMYVTKFSVVLSLVGHLKRLHLFFSPVRI